MLKHHLKIISRSLLKDKGYSAITICGLAVGMACCLLILLYVRDELSYDWFLPNADRIYRVIAERGKGNETRLSANTSYPILPHLQTDFAADIVIATRARQAFKPVLRSGGKKFREARFFLVDSTFLDVFQYTMLRGDRRTALRSPDGVVMTAATAQRYFGDEQAIGKTVTYQTGDEPITFTVTGVLQDLPHHTHLHFDMLAPITAIPGPFESWQTFVRNYSYLVLPNGYDPGRLESEFRDFIDRHVRAQLEPGEVFNLYLQPVTDIHLYSHYMSEVAPNGNIAHVYLFSAIALFVLLIASTNFVNLTTARSVRRAREVGLRKTVGATRTQLIVQFLGESIALSLLALLGALLLIETVLPEFNNFTGKEFALSHLVNGPMLLAFPALTLLVGILAGLYPAFLLSNFRPASVLKGQASAGKKRVAIREGLVVFQFAVSIVLIACTAIVDEQMQYVQSKDLGFDKEQVVVVPVNEAAVAHATAIKQTLMQYGNITSASFSSLVPSTDLWTYNVRTEANQNSMGIGFYKVDHDFVETYRLEMAAGHNFQPGRPTDSTAAFLLNEEAARRLGYATPDQAIGQQLVFGDGSRNGKVIGVVEDFHVESLHQEIAPMIFFLEPDHYYLSVRINPPSIGETLEHIENTLTALAPQLPFEYQFIDERFEALHRQDLRLQHIFGIFACIAIFIACLGLLGLASFATAQRTKEIGIRKTLGASVAGVVGLLSKDFVKPVLVANLIAWPIAWYAMNTWLQDFAYRIPVSWWTLASAGSMALAIALLTTCTHAIKASLANPVDALRHE